MYPTHHHLRTDALPTHALMLVITTSNSPLPSRCQRYTTQDTLVSYTLIQGLEKKFKVTIKAGEAEAHLGKIYVATGITYSDVSCSTPENDHQWPPPTTP